MLLLHEILKPEHKTVIVDVGAAAIDGRRPYENLLQLGLCTVIGFEPQKEFWPKPRFASFEVYHPDIIGDGSDGVLRLYKAAGLTSLFDIDKAAIDIFPAFSDIGEIVRTEPVKTKRLDDIKDIVRIDFLKIDAQGSELAVIQGAAAKLNNAVVVQAEVQFVRLYADQPMFRDIDAEMARRGFLLHTFSESIHIMIKPYQHPGQPNACMRQVLSADAVYVRDFSRLDRLEHEQVKQMAMIAHYCYGSFDLAYRCIDYLSSIGVLPAGEANRYMKSLEDADGEGNSSG